MATIKRHIVRRAFDSYKPGDEYIPNGKKNAKLIIEYYCNTVIEDEPAMDGFVCGKCERVFTTPQGLAAHKRRCKGGKDGK